MYNDFLRMSINTLTTKCFIRWRDGGKLAPTLREHAMAYFVPSDASIKLLTTVAPSLGMDAPKLIEAYKVAIEANRLTWEGYTDVQAQQVYDNWWRNDN